jgi:hypothetical protein
MLALLRGDASSTARRDARREWPHWVRMTDRLDPSYRS